VAEVAEAGDDRLYGTGAARRRSRIPRVEREEMTKERDELGAHVSAAGGVEFAPERANDIESSSLQLFTKQPNRWNEPTVSVEQAAAFVDARKKLGIRVAGAHDSYLINLSSPDATLWKRSLSSFTKEFVRCNALGLEFMVTHPGNATDGDVASGIARNAEGVTRALEEISGPTRVLLEITAGSGSSIGGSFEALAGILAGIPAAQRARMGVCFDACHAYSTGYDLVKDYDGVWARFDELLGFELLGLFHMNDSKNPFASHKDRHEHIGEGSLGEEPFRRIMNDDRFRSIPKVLETPKEDDPVATDLRNLGRLRSFRLTT
jgi:deoxyribonuclease-4